ncbi:hypothetical protein BKA67DRAFT_659367 [Truncatella angustata]|uniref:Uncharacterized protein n=1 Tax=Truncatella angustata TaxID=152316 RepID=A0A9P8ZW49_9PEZI|nr:uncharacterized protein BKA67DRAFT_659367 [Truncatella angustata]KAH6652681.1 hypothetical protein BKA67DRAFT_659367 [Truncatella angustata]KAH8195498.1 hypothetical protein TruAng_010327 [Truncatella angustata]
MLSSTETVLPPTTQAGLYFDPPTFDSSSTTVDSTGPRSLRRHKNLPHPRNSTPSIASNLNQNPRASHGSRLAIDTKASCSESRSRPSSQLSSPPSQARRSVGPDLPPTPPAHSRTSSSSQSAQPSSPTYVETPAQSASNLSLSASATRLPGTPPNQRSPPTPDVTPPQQTRRPKAIRPLLYERIASNATTAGSRTESFKTAREDPYSSDDDRRSTLRPNTTSRRTSQNTVRQASNNSRQNKSKSLGLGLGQGPGLESDDNLTPRTKQEFGTFDGEWGSRGTSGDEVEQEWDDNLMRNVTVRKRQAKPKMVGGNASADKVAEVIEDVPITPTNATKALRSMPLHQDLRMRSSPRGTPDRGKRWSSAPAVDSPVQGDTRRFSGMSTKSTVSTVVEAILVDAPPRRHKTLRHVKKQSTLRESLPQISPKSSTANSLGFDETIRRHRPRMGMDAGRTDSYASSATVNSLASRKARRDVWKSGGIPVVVIPDRIASIKSAETHSLRSTSSRRSQRSNSLSSVPASNSNQAKAKETPPIVERTSRRGRAMSMSGSDGSLPGDQRTMDYPPIVPLRSSSLSAPTSRNNSRSNSRSNSQAGSRTGSLTADSLKLHNALQAAQSAQAANEQQTRNQPPPKVTVEREPSLPGVEYIPAESEHSDQRQLQPTICVESHREKDAHDHRPLVDHNGDPFFGKRLTAHTTPFSIASVETNGTHSAAEVSEAMAVSIYPHQNRSVLMVNHLSRAFEANLPEKEVPASTDETEEQSVPAPEKPSITTTGPDGEPVTPPQPQFSMDDVDSPLRNPRAPPEPPAIKFIPATPSGLTPAAEKMKMLGNYFETDDPPTVEKRPSIVKRAFSLRKNSENSSSRPGLLMRTLSLGRNVRKDTAENPDIENGPDAIRHQYPTIEDPPADEDRLHPFWRPASAQFDFDFEDGEDWVHDIPDDVDQVYRYPAPETPRPPPPRRTLSARMKQTFAILPITSEAHYMSAGTREPERRTIKRTPSGNLRVTRQHDSVSTLRWPGRDRSSSPRRHRKNREKEPDRPSSAPNSRPGRRAWGVEKRVDSHGNRFFPGWQDKLGQVSIQGLQRRLSEKRREKRSEELRQKISGPREVRDGVGEVTKRNSYHGPSYQTGSTVLRSNSHSLDDVEGVERAPRVQVQV